MSRHNTTETGYGQKQQQVTDIKMKNFQAASVGARQPAGGFKFKFKSYGGRPMSEAGFFWSKLAFPSSF